MQNQSSLEDDIVSSRFIIDKTKIKKPNNETPKSFGYGLNGPVDSKNDECLAKSVYDTVSGNFKYWIKRATSGQESGDLFNPQGLFFDTLTQNKFNNRKGQSQYEFCKCNKITFNLYLRFLETKNILYLKQAQRELNNG